MNADPNRPATNTFTTPDGLLACGRCGNAVHVPDGYRTTGMVWFCVCDSTAAVDPWARSSALTASTIVITTAPGGAHQ